MFSRILTLRIYYFFHDLGFVKTCYEHVISNIFSLKVRTSFGLDICTMEIVMILLNSKKKIEGFWNLYNLLIFSDVIGRVINFEYSIHNWLFCRYIVWVLYPKHFCKTQLGHKQSLILMLCLNSLSYEIWH